MPDIAPPDPGAARAPLLSTAAAAQVKSFARSVGFDLVGIAPADASARGDYFRRWLSEGQAGGMTYLEARADERVDPRAYLPDAASIVCVAMNYHVPLDPVPEAKRYTAGRVARYALGDDYHEVIRGRLHQLADWMRQSFPGSQTRACVDTAPVLEKDVAARAGIGWIGKNTCLIHPRGGSWLLLGEVITTLRLPIDEPSDDHCGSCTRCIEACPTAAITAPYQLDARRCISYLTIEHRDEIAEQFKPLIQDWLYGCDICQDVCPFNQTAPTATAAELQPRFPTGTLNVDQILGWTPSEYQTSLRRSAMKRVKLPMLQRNATIVKRNLLKGALRPRGAEQP